MAVGEFVVVVAVVVVVVVVIVVIRVVAAVAGIVGVSVVLVDKSACWMKAGQAVYSTDL